MTKSIMILPTYSEKWIGIEVMAKKGFTNFEEANVFWNHSALFVELIDIITSDLFFFLQAVTKGYWLLLEDIDYAPMDVISILVPLLESRTLSLAGKYV